MHLKKAVAAFGRPRLFEMADEVLTRARSHRVQIQTDTVNSEREHVFLNMRTAFAAKPGLPLHDLVERKLSRQEDVEQDAEAPEVRAEVVRDIETHLGRRVLARR